MSDDPDDDPEDEDGNWDGRVTLCISTQIGCAMGCVFCASGQAGLERGLRADEVVAQVLLARQHLDRGERLRNLVFMGMGEPLHHYDETARAIRLLTHPDGFGMSPRRITVSTVGLVPGIRRLGEDFGGKVGLALSLHAPNDDVRGRILPMNKRYPVADVLGALRAYPLAEPAAHHDRVHAHRRRERRARARARAVPCASGPARQGEPDSDEPDHGQRPRRTLR